MQPLESINALVFPPQLDFRLQELTQRKAQGKLTEAEAQEFDLLMETKRTLAQLRAKAKTLLSPSQTVTASLRHSVRNGLPVVQVPAGTPAIDPDVVRRFLQEQVF